MKFKEKGEKEGKMCSLIHRNWGWVLEKQPHLKSENKKEKGVQCSARETISGASTQGTSSPSLARQEKIITQPIDDNDSENMNASIKEKVYI